MGELSAKTAAKSYWKKELEDELDDLQLREEWTFGKANEGQQHTGSEDDAMEFVESKRSEQLYNHNCSKKCQDKGLFFIVHVAYGTCFGITFRMPAEHSESGMFQISRNIVLLGAMD